MFTNLPASGGRKRGFFSARSTTVSVALHGLLIAGAVYASVAIPKEAEKVEEEVTFVEIEEQEPEAPQAAEPPPPPPEPVAAPPPPQGFQELVPPQTPPPVIPDVDTSQPAVSAEDFSGVGVAGGTAQGVEGGTPQNTAAVDSTAEFTYEVASLDAPPQLANAGQVRSALERLYPRMLQDAGIDGTVMMRFVITPEGKVEPGSAEVVSASHEKFGEASLKALERFRFRPGRYKGQPVRVLIQMPITWKPQT